MDELEFASKVVLVTGGGRGIGRAISQAFASRGAAVAVCARSEGEISQVADGIIDAGGRALAVRCDVGSMESVDACVQRTVGELGPVDILINSAGISPSVPVHKMSSEVWDRTIATNLSGAFYLTRAVLPSMLDRGYGRVIHLASVAGKAGMAYVSAYCASKHGLMGFVRAVAHEVATKGVTINAICPGYVDSPMTDQNCERIAETSGRDPELIRAHMVNASPQGRLIEDSEVAACALYLASDLARGVHGQGINVCGGTVMS